MPEARLFGDHPMFEPHTPVTAFLPYLPDPGTANVVFLRQHSAGVFESIAAADDVLDLLWCQNVVAPARRYGRWSAMFIESSEKNTNR